LKKISVMFLAIVSTVALCLALIPNVSSQIENVEVLTYKWYMSPYYSDYLIIVGEVQNVGPNIIGSVVVTGTFYAPDGTEFMYNFAKTLTTQILPQQKSPFYITFSPANIAASTTWETAQVTNYTIAVTLANPTSNQQYQGLEITSHSGSADDFGYYSVTGTLKNTGSYATNKTWVVATFYNSTGNVVAVGFSSVLTPYAIQPGSTREFSLYPADYELTSGYISSYSLVVQTSLDSPSATPTPTTPTNPTQFPTQTPTGTASPSPTPLGTGTGIPEILIFAAAAVVAVAVVIVVVAFVFRKRGSKGAATAKQIVNDEEQPPTS
jgi:hypothetical protein